MHEDDSPSIRTFKHGLWRQFYKKGYRLNKNWIGKLWEEFCLAVRFKPLKSGTKKSEHKWAQFRKLIYPAKLVKSSTFPIYYFHNFVWIFTDNLITVHECLHHHNNFGANLIRQYTHFYREFGCLAFSPRFWSIIRQLLSNCPSSDWSFSKTVFSLKRCKNRL